MDDLKGMLNQLGADQSGQSGGTAAANPAGAVTALAGAIGEQGGIDGLLDRLRSAGLGSQVDSWIGTGANQTVAPQQLGAALGDEKVKQLSASSGISIGQLLPLLAAFLPTIVDLLTPHGSAPAGGVNQAAANAGPELGGLLGGVLGGLGGAGGGQGGQPDLGGLLGGLLGGQTKP